MSLAARASLGADHVEPPASALGVADRVLNDLPEPRLRFVDAVAETLANKPSRLRLWKK